MSTPKKIGDLMPAALPKSPNTEISVSNYKPKSSTSKTKEWDDIYATFYWRFILDRNNAENNASLIFGYSKKANQRERMDKEAMLRRKILSLWYNYDYRKRASCWEIKMRVGDFIDVNKDPVILLIYPTHYDIPMGIKHDYVWKNIGPFLDDFFSRIKSGRDMTNILPPDKKGKGGDDFLNVHANDHLTPEHLQAYSRRLARHGHPEGAILNYIHKYKMLKGWL